MVSLDTEMAEAKASVPVVKKNRTPEVCTALHIVKGALVKVFNTPLTTAVVFNNKTCGTPQIGLRFPEHLIEAFARKGRGRIE